MVTIIPDVHGRPFWHNAVEQALCFCDEDPIIFLCDYVDSNLPKSISPCEVIENLREIIEFAKEHSNVTLLLGDHDLAYVNLDMHSNQRDLEHLQEIQNLFMANRELFKIAIIAEEDGESFVYSHAGILKEWASCEPVQRVLQTDSDDIKAIVDRLNELWIEDDPALYPILDMASLHHLRFDYCGSPVWAHLREWSNTRADYPGFRQVFGHTPLKSHPVVTPFYAALDCRKAIFNIEGIFSYASR